MSADIKLAIIALKPLGSGDEVELTVLLESGSIPSLNRELRVMLVGSRMLFELGNIGASVLPYTLTREQFDLLDYDVRLWEVVKRGMGLLSYADSSKRRLRDKLCERGFDRELASDAVEYIASLGLIDESRQLAREVEKLVSRGYGRSRIRAELLRKGFSGEFLSESLPALLDGIDFDAILNEQVSRKCDASRVLDRAYVERVVAAMYRLGHAPGEARRAIRELAERED